MKEILLVIGLMTTLSGCGTNGPYVEIGIGYQIDEMTDWWLRTERPDTCDNNDVFHIEAGYEFENQWTVGYTHQSHVSCGGPFNDKPEMYRDEIIVTKKWGGRK